MGRLGRDRARPCWQPAEPSEHPLGDGKANTLSLLKTGSRARGGRTGNFRATKEGSMWSGHWIGPVMSTVELGLLVLVTLAGLGSAEEEGILDTYWSGTAPICLGGCKGKHQELKRSQCGNGSCCWLGYKSFCRVNCGRPETDFNSVVYGNDWWVGSVVRYSCRSGFLLVGDPASACQSDGHWTPKPTCLRICLRGQIEINERDIDGSCSSSCTKKAHLGAFLNHGCIKISNCITKQRGWMRWFTRCDFCECDCYIPCSSSG